MANKVTPPITRNKIKPEGKMKSGITSFAKVKLRAYIKLATKSAVCAKKVLFKKFFKQK